MPEQSSLEVTIANRYGIDPEKFKETLVKTCFPPDKQNVSNEQYTAFLVVCNEHELNPFTREIFAFPQGNTIVPVVGADGWIKLTNQHPKFDGIEFDEVFDDSGSCTAITATVYRKDRSHPTKITEYMSECRRGNFGPWKSHPIRMLRHKTLIQAARVVFGFAGIYDQDEAERILEATSSPDTSKPKTQRLAEQIKSAMPSEAASEESPVEVCSKCGSTDVELVTQDGVCAGCAEPPKEIVNDVPAEKPRPRKIKPKTETPTSPDLGEFDEAGKALYDSCKGIVREVQFPTRLIRTEGTLPDAIKDKLLNEMKRLGQSPTKLNGVCKRWLGVESYITLTDGAAECFVEALGKVKSESDK